MPDPRTRGTRSASRFRFTSRSIEFREYGTPGIARAQHLAALATGDPTRTQAAEQALLGCLTDERQLARLTDPGICHGLAGLVHTARSAIGDGANSDLIAAVHQLAERLHQHPYGHAYPADDGFLEGTAGTALVGLSLTDPDPSRWDTCLLIR